MERNVITTRVQVTERHERCVVALHGSPSRPVIIPMANVDFEPDGETFFRVTMSSALAKEVGIYI